jgi:hypothetical protein
MFDSFAGTIAEALQYERCGGEEVTALKDERKSLQKKVEGLEYKLEAEKQRWQKLLEDANAGFDEEKRALTEGKQKLLQELAALSEQKTAALNQTSNPMVDELQSQIKAKDANLAMLRGLADTKDKLWRNEKATVRSLQARLDSAAPDENAAALAAQATARIAQLEQALAQKDAKVQELTSSLSAVTVERDEQSSQVRTVTNQVKQLLREAKLKNERIEELTEDHTKLCSDAEEQQKKHTTEIQLREDAIAELHAQLTTQEHERLQVVAAATTAREAADVQSATREALLVDQLERAGVVAGVRAGTVKSAVDELRRLHPLSIGRCERKVYLQMPDLSEEDLHFCVLNEFFKTCTTELAAGAAAASGTGGATCQGRGSAAPAPAASGAAASRAVQTQSPSMTHGTIPTAKTVQPSRAAVPAVLRPAVAVPAVAAPATPVTKTAPVRTTTPSQVLSRPVTPPQAPAPVPNATAIAPVSAPVSTPVPVLPPPVSASHVKASVTTALPVPPLPPPQQPTARALPPSAFLTTFSSQQTEEPSQQQQSSPVPSRRASPAFTPSSQADIMDLTGDD